MTGFWRSALLCIVVAASVPCRSLGFETLLLKGGTVVNADGKRQSDVLIRDGVIQRVAPDISVPDGKGVRVLDVRGKLVMPGGIDPHTHCDMPFMGTTTADDFFSCQAAALAGGTTMHIDFALPVDHDVLRGFTAWQEKARRSCMDYGFHMAVTTWNDAVSRDLGELSQRGINSIKFFMAYKGALMVNDDQLLHGFERCKALGLLPQVHAENGDAVAYGQQRVFESGITGPEGHALSRPAVLEGEATARAIRLAAFVNVPLYVVHVMSADAMDEVARARAKGQRVIGEPVVSGLALNESMLWHDDFGTAAQYVMSPPIRAAEHGDALKRGVAGGVLSLVATDHAVFNSSQKSAGKNDFRLIPNGVNGIEERLHVVWHELVNTGLITACDFVRITSTAAAQIFNIYPRKGVIAEGSDADVIVFDATAQHVISAATHHSRIDTNVYEGMHVTGKVVTTISRGRVVWDDDQLFVEPGTGQFIPMPPFGPLFEGLELQDQLVRPQSRQPAGSAAGLQKDEL